MKIFFIQITISLILITLLISQIPAQSVQRIQAENLFIEAQKSLSLGDEEDAEKLLMEALNIDPDFTSAIWQLAQIYEKKRKLEHARELILRGLDQDPNSSWANEKLSQIETKLTHKLLHEAKEYMSAGEYDRAIPKLSLYIGIRPYESVPLIQMSRCHLALGNLNTSRQYLLQAMERDPSDEEIKRLLSEIERRLDGNSVEILKQKANDILTTYSVEKEESAREALKAILEIEPNDKWALEKLNELDLISSNRAKEDSNSTAKNMEITKAITRKIGSVSRTPLFIGCILMLATILILLILDLKKRHSSRMHPLQGSLELLPILDTTSLLNSNLITGRMIIKSEKGNGEIFFEKGEIIHARFKTLGGKEAFHRLMNIKHGSFTFSNHLPKVRHTISEPLSLLLLSMRSRDNSVPYSKENNTKDEELVTSAD